MKHFFTATVILIIIFFTTSCFDSDSSSTKNLPDDTKDISYSEVEYSVDYNPREPLLKTLPGNDNDEITINIPKNAVSMSTENYQGVNFDIKFIYENDKFTKLVFDQDLNFNTPVSIKFNVNSLSDDSRFLVYTGDEQYYIPFTKTDNIYTYQFEHLSTYEFQQTESSTDLKNKIENLITTLQNDVDKTEGVETHINDFNEILAIIKILEIKNDTQADIYADQISTIMADYAKSFINNVSAPSSYLKGYCMSSDAESKIRQLVKNWSVLETTDSQASENNTAENTLKTWISNTADAFTAQDFNLGCSGLAEYMICGSNISAQAELAGFQDKADLILAKLQSEFTKNINVIISEEVKVDLTNCSELADCLITALYIAKTFNITSEFSSIESRLNDVHQQCISSKCPYAWDITAEIEAQYNPDNSFKHSAVFKNLIFVTDKDESDAAELNSECYDLKKIDPEKTVYNDSDPSTLNFSGTFYPNLNWTGSLIPNIYIDNGNEQAEEAFFTTDIIPFIKAHKSFSIDITKTPEEGGTVKATLNFTPHVLY